MSWPRIHRARRYGGETARGGLGTGWRRLGMERNTDNRRRMTRSRASWNGSYITHTYTYADRADSRFAPSQWETALLCNDVSHWLGASPESALCISYLSTFIHRLKHTHAVVKHIYILPGRKVWYSVVGSEWGLRPCRFRFTNFYTAPKSILAMFWQVL